MSAAPDVLVVGGGLAGAGAALKLALGGVRVTLLEREPGPHHKVCGEFLSHEAAADLAALGLDVRELAPAAIDRVRLTSRGEGATATLPFTGFGLSRHRLDAWLLQHAERAGVTVRRGVTVRGLTGAAGRAEATLADGARLVAAAAFLATGKHELRAFPRRPPYPALADIVAYKAHLRLPPAQLTALSGIIELHLAADAYAGLQRIEGGIATLCLVVGSDAHRAAGGSFAGTVDWLCRGNAALAERLGGAEPLWERPLAIARVPYGWRYHATDDAPPAVWRVGDQLAVTPSFTGDGMAIAIRSARLAAELCLAGADAGAYHRRAAAEVGAQLSRATAAAGLLHRPGLHPWLIGAARRLPIVLATAARLTRLPPWGAPDPLPAR